jgi:hypothetical protein
MMNRKDFLSRIWIKNIRPLMWVSAIVIVAAILLTIPSVNLGILDWYGIGIFFIAVFKIVWPFILFAFLLSILVKILRKITPPAYHQMFDKAIRIIDWIIFIGIVAWFGYRFYQHKQYGTMIWIGIFAGISMLTSYFQRDRQTQQG